MPVSALMAGSRMLTADVLALTTSVDTQVARTPLVRAAVVASAMRRSFTMGEHPPKAPRPGWSWRASNAVRRRPRPALERPQVPEHPDAVLDLLRHLGVAMCDAGDAADRVTPILDDVAGASTPLRPSTSSCCPPGSSSASRRADRAGSTSRPRAARPLRLDQVDALYRLIDDIRHARIDVHNAPARLDALLTAQPRFAAVTTILGNGLLTVGLGLLLNPTASALPVYFGLGLLVGLLELWAARRPNIAVILPVLTAFVITWAAFELAQPMLDAWPLDIVIPSLVVLLPGAALTMAAIELSGDR